MQARRKGMGARDYLRLSLANQSCKQCSFLCHRGPDLKGGWRIMPFRDLTKRDYLR